jgi:hypothetical protein
MLFSSWVGLKIFGLWHCLSYHSKLETQQLCLMVVVCPRNGKLYKIGRPIQHFIMIRKNYVILFKPYMYKNKYKKIITHTFLHAWYTSHMH